MSSQTDNARIRLMVKEIGETIGEEKYLALDARDIAISIRSIYVYLEKNKLLLDEREWKKEDKLF